MNILYCDVGFNNSTALVEDGYRMFFFYYSTFSLLYVNEIYGCTYSSLFGIYGSKDMN